MKNQYDRGRTTDFGLKLQSAIKVEEPRNVVDQFNVADPPEGNEPVLSRYVQPRSKWLSGLRTFPPPQRPPESNPEPTPIRAEAVVTDNEAVSGPVLDTTLPTPPPVSQVAPPAKPTNLKELGLNSLDAMASSARDRVTVIAFELENCRKQKDKYEELLGLTNADIQRRMDEVATLNEFVAYCDETKVQIEKVSSVLRLEGRPPKVPKILRKVIEPIAIPSVLSEPTPAPAEPPQTALVFVPEAEPVIEPTQDLEPAEAAPKPAEKAPRGKAKPVEEPPRLKTTDVLTAAKRFRRPVTAKDLRVPLLKVYGEEGLELKIANALAYLSRNGTLERVDRGTYKVAG